MKISLPLSLITGPECAKVSGDGGSHTHTTRQIVVIFVFELFDFFIIREWDARILPCRYSNGYDMAGPWILSVPYVHRLPIIMFILADSTKGMERWLIITDLLCGDRHAHDLISVVRRRRRRQLWRSRYFYFDNFTSILSLWLWGSCSSIFVELTSYHQWHTIFVWNIKKKKSNSVFKITNGTENEIETMKHSH